MQTKLSNGDHTLVQAGTPPQVRVVTVTNNGKTLTDGDDVLTWDPDSRSYRNDNRIMRFFIEGQLYSDITLSPMGAEVGTWS